MNKKIRNIVSLKVPAGEASSKPPLGSTIGQFGVPIMDFCNLFNKVSMENNYKKGILINCKMYIYHDFSFDVMLKNVDLGYLIKIVLKDELITGKKNLSTRRGRVQSILFGVKKRAKRKKKKKFTLLYLTTTALFEIGKKKYSFLENQIGFISYYKTLIGSCRSMGIFIFPSYFFSNYEKIHMNYFLSLININNKSRKFKSILTNNNSDWFFK